MGGDFNPYYHRFGDTSAIPTSLLHKLCQSIYCHLCTHERLSDPDGVGTLDGHVSAAGGGTPIENATVIANDGEGHTYSTKTDSAGYFKIALIADTYTVTAFACSILPTTINEVIITA